MTNASVAGSALEVTRRSFAVAGIDNVRDLAADLKQALDAV